MESYPPCLAFEYSDIIDTIDASVPTEPISDWLEKQWSTLNFSELQALHAETRYQVSQLTEPFSSQKVPSREDWDLHRSTITRLYRDEKRPLKDVAEFMLKHHGHKANERMYKKRITDWDIRRNLRWSEKEAICQVIRRKRLVLDANAAILVKGQKKKMSLFTRHMKQRRRSAYAKNSLVWQIASAGADTRFQSRSEAGFRSLQRTFAPKACIRSTMYPPGDERVMEIICSQTSYACEVGFSGQFEVKTDAHRLVLLANDNAVAGRYREARILLNKAGVSFKEEAVSRPNLALLSIFDYFRSSPSSRHDLFDVFNLFQAHALEISTAVHGPQHPLTSTLSLFFKLKSRTNTLVAALQSALAILRRKKDVRGSVRINQWLRRTLSSTFEVSGESSRAESLLLALAEEYEEYDYDDANRVVISFNLGYLYTFSGRYDEAEKLLNDIIIISGRSYPTHTNRDHECAYLANRGLCLLAQVRGEQEKAVDYARICFAAAIRCWGEEAPATLRAAERLAQLLEKQGRLTEAEEARRMVNFKDDLHWSNLD